MRARALVGVSADSAELEHPASLGHSASLGTSAPLSKSERAHAHLRAAIAQGEYAHGDRLVLGRIASELGMSVVPVREAVRRLEAEGLVTFHRNVGATVARIDPEEYLHTMQTLGVIEGAATALAAPHLSQEDVDLARSINEELRKQLEGLDGPRFTDLNARFHAVLHSRCPNPHLSDLVDRGWTRLDRLRRSTFTFVPHRASESVAEHEEILRIIESGEGYEAIEAATRRHRWNTVAAFQESLARAPKTGPVDFSSAAVPL